MVLLAMRIRGVVHSTVPVKLMSSLGLFIHYRYQLKKKLNLFKLTPFMVNSVLAEGKGGFIRAKLVCKTLENFFASADEELTIDHVPIWCKNSQGQRVMVEQSEKLVSESPVFRRRTPCDLCLPFPQNHFQN